MATFSEAPLLRAEDMGNRSLVDILMEIQKLKSVNEKSLDWIDNLQCLTAPKSPRARTLYLNYARPRNKPFATKYVAVSHSWTAMRRLEDDGQDIWYVKRPGKTREKLAIHVSVLRRVLAYANHMKCQFVWIDQECVDQESPRKKQEAMDSMDLVYCRSEYPLGLLSFIFHDGQDIRAFQHLLNGNCVQYKEQDPQPFKLSCHPGTRERLMRLLERLGEDSWWERAWIFQEEYLSLGSLVLLARHSPGLEAAKREAFPKGLFGCVEGELSFSAMRLREQATAFVLAVKSTPSLVRCLGRCDDLLQIFGKYSLLYNHEKVSQGKAMSSRIFADIEKREVMENWDRIPIAANACDYAIRFDSETMAERHFGVGIYSLAMFLLNGEIIDNSKAMRKDPTQTSLSEFLDYVSFSKFDPPLFSGHLTWLKNCRFSNVEFSKEGIDTTGYLWRIYRAVNPFYFFSHWSQAPCLEQLAGHLWEEGEGVLADHLWDYLSQDADETIEPGKFLIQDVVKNHKDTMAEAIIEGIRAKKTLLLARLKGSSGGGTAFRDARAIFVKPAEGNMKWAFTDWYCKEDKDGRERERHLYLKVEVNRLSKRPLLRTMNWANGLAFFNGCWRSKVTIQWPQAWKQPKRLPKHHSRKRAAGNEEHDNFSASKRTRRRSHASDI